MSSQLRLRAIPTSPTSGLNSRVRELIASGQKIIRLSAGEAGGLPPLHVRQAAAAAAAGLEGHEYGPIGGLPALRARVAQAASLRSGVPVSSANVVITNGAKQAIFVVCLALLSPSDQVLIPVPAWPTFARSVALAGAEATEIPTSMSNRYQVTISELDRYATPRARMLILSSPGNPTGSVYDAATLAEIGVWCAARDIVVLVDEVYREIRFTAADVPPLRVLRDVGAQALITDSVSKTYSMAGWRVGWVIGPDALAQVAQAVLSHTSNHVSYVAQIGALAALEGDQKCVTELRTRLAENRQNVLSHFRGHPSANLRPPDGSFYAFPSFAPLIGPGARFATSLELAEELLEQAGVAVVPGQSFGAPAHLRLSFCGDRSLVDAGVSRMLSYLAVPG